MTLLGWENIHFIKPENMSHYNFKQQTEIVLREKDEWHEWGLKRNSYEYPINNY